MSTKIKVKCSHCEQIFIREIGRFNEAKKFDWNQYCSKKCQYKNKTEQKIFKCSNQECGKIFSRTPKDIRSQNLFCSQSCAAIINNKKRAIKTKIKICPVCNKNFYSANKYCSLVCYAKVANSERKIPIELYRKKTILHIASFYNKNNRIPAKKEMYSLYRVARKAFGTWNKAIIAAGFKPNPVLFAKKYIANDGHVCDSFSEKIIDDWFSARKIKHERGVPYPENKKLTADFKINDKFVEFFGLSGQIKKYDRNIKLKEKLAKKYKIKLIKIFPKDLFPHSKLSEIIKI